MKEDFSRREIFDRIEWLVIAANVYGMICGALLAWKWYLETLVACVYMILVFVYVGTIWAETVKKHLTGLRGELRTSAILDLLPEQDFLYKNDIVWPDVFGNIDHIVVAKTGVWVIDSKGWSDDVVRSYASKLEDDFKALSGRAKTVKEIITDSGENICWVQPVIVCTEAADASLSRRNSFIVNLKGIAPLLRSEDPQRLLTRDQCKRIYELISQRALKLRRETSVS
jgi:hypothetical protein